MQDLLPKSKFKTSASEPISLIVTFVLLVAGFGIWFFWNPVYRVIASLDTPQIISFQGKLTDDTRVTVDDGNYTMKFAIYTTSGAGGCLWSAGNNDANVTTADCDQGGAGLGPEQGITVSVVDGVFSVLLGDTGQNALPDTLFDDNSTLYLGVSIGADAEMSPRIRLGSVPYALQAGDADLLDSLDSGVFLRSDVSDTFTGGNAQTLTINSDLTAASRSVSLLSITQPDNVTYNSTGNLFNITQSDVESTGDALNIVLSGAGNAIDVQTTLTGPNADSPLVEFGVTSSSYDQPVLFLDVNTNNPGAVGLSILDTGNAATDLLIQSQSNRNDVVHITQNRTSDGITDWNNEVLSVTRDNNVATSSFGVTAPVALIANNSAGTYTSHTGPVLSVQENYLSATGSTLYVLNRGTGLSLRVDDILSDTSPFVVDANGNVGIGTSTPDADIDIEGVEDTERIRLTDTTNGDSLGLYVGDGTAGLDGVLSAQAGSLFLDEDGLLWVNVDGATNWETVVTGTVTTTLQDAYDNGNTITATDARDISFSLANTATDPNFKIDLLGAGDFIINDVALDTTPFIVNDAGFVGIGTASPDSHLTIDIDADTGLHIINDGFAEIGLDIDHTGGGGIPIDIDVSSDSNGNIMTAHHIATYTTSRNLTTQGVLIGQILTMNDGGSGTQTLNILDDLLRVTFAGTETSGNITYSGNIASFDQNFVEATGSVVETENSGTGVSIDIRDSEDSQFIRLSSASVLGGSLTDSVGIYSGDGTAGLDGTLSAQAGSLFLDVDGKLWVNVNGATDWDQVSTGTTAVDSLDDAYNNFGANPSLVSVDGSEGQTGELEFSMDGVGIDFVVDLQSTGDFVIQTSGANTFSVNGNGKINHDPADYSASAGTQGIAFNQSAMIGTDSSTAASGTNAFATFNRWGQSTIAAQNISVTTTNAATLYVEGGPLAGTNNTITNSYGLWIDSGGARIDGTILTDDLSCTDCLDFTEFVDSMTVDANVIIDQGTNTWTQNFTGTSTTGISYNANSLTSGSAMRITSSSASFTGNLLDLNVSNASASGNVIDIDNDGGGIGLYINDALSTAATPAFKIETGSAYRSTNIMEIVNNNNQGGTNTIFIDNNGYFAGVLAIDTQGVGGDVVGAVQSRAFSTGTFEYSDNMLELSRTPSVSGGTISNTGHLLYINSDATGSGYTGTNTASLAYLRQNDSNSTGNALEIWNSGTGIGAFLDQNGNAAALSIDSEATTANGLVIDTSVLTTGSALSITTGNTTNDSGLALFIDSGETTETADIVRIDTDYGTPQTVFKIEADGEVFSDVGFNAGGASTHYYDGTIDKTDGALSINAINNYPVSIGTGLFTINGLMTHSPSASTFTPSTQLGALFHQADATVTDGATATSGTNILGVGFNRWGQPTYGATNSSVTTSNAATLLIDGPPIAGTNMTITNPYSLWVDEGNVRLDGGLYSITSNPTIQGLNRAAYFDASFADPTSFSSVGLAANVLDSSTSISVGRDIIGISAGSTTQVTLAGGSVRQYGATIGAHQNGSTGTIDDVIGVFAQARKDDVGDVTNLYGISSDVIGASPGNHTNAFAYYGNLSRQGQSFAVITDGGGIDLDVTATDGITYTNMFGSRATLSNILSTVTTAYGSMVDVDAGTTRYGYYADVNPAGTTNWAFYSPNATSDSAFNDNVFVGGVTETLSNTGFVMDGDDFFVAGMAGIEGDVYTDGSFIAGTGSLTMSDTGIVDSNGALFLDGTTGVTIGKDLAVNGTILTLDANNAGAGADLRIIANQGSDLDGEIRYNSTTNQWEMSNNGGGFSAIATSAGTTTLQQAYDNGKTITGTQRILFDINGNTGTTISDTLGGAFHISNTGNNNYGFTMYSNNASAASPLVEFETGASFGTQQAFVIDNNSSTGGSMQIQHGSLGIGLEVSVLGANAQAGVFIGSNSITTGQLLEVQDNTGALTSGNLIRGFSSSNSLSSGDLLNLFHSATYASGGTVSGNGIDLSRSLSVSAGTLNLSGALMSLSSNLTGAGTENDTANLLSINQSNTSATGSVQQIVNAGTGSSLYIDQNGSTSGTVSDTLGGALHISNTSNNSQGLTVYSNNGAGQNYPLASLVSANGAFDEETLVIYNAGTSNALFVTKDTGLTTIKGAQELYIDSSKTASGEVFAIESDAGSSDNKVFAIEADGDFLYDGTGSSPASDLAEVYASDDTLSAGDLVSIDPTQTEKVRMSTDAYDPYLFGGVSTKPAVRMGADTAGYDIALTGRIPLNVSDENGSISAGDPLTSSATPGHAMKATRPGMIVGFALEDFAGPGTGTISVYIDAGWHAGNMLGIDGSAMLVNGDTVVAPTGTADSSTTGYESSGLSLRGSGWDGAAAQNVEMKLVNTVTDATDYHLSIRNTSDTEVAYITNTGAMTVSGDMHVGGKIYPSDQGTLQSDFYIYFDSSLGPGMEYMRTNAAGWSTGSYDFAEMFPSSQALEAGDVVVFDTISEYVRKSSVPYDQMIAGIVSTRPGFLAGDAIKGHFPIALSGRVPTKVTLEGGTIAVGDALTTSSTSGSAMKATQSGPIIGYALEPYTGSGDNKIIAFVRASYWSGGTTTSTPGTQSTASGVGQNLTSLNMEGNIYMHGYKIVSIGALEGIGKHWSINGDGLFSTEGSYDVVIESYQGEKIPVHSSMNMEQKITLSGTGELVNGSATVAFEDHSPEFNDVTSTMADVRVMVTLRGSANGIYVEQADHDGFTVMETMGGNSDAPFDWFVEAYRKGYEPEEQLLIDAPVEEPAVQTDPVETTAQTVPLAEGQTTQEPPAETPPAEESPAVEPPPSEPTATEPVAPAEEPPSAEVTLPAEEPVVVDPAGTEPPPSVVAEPSI